MGAYYADAAVVARWRFTSISVAGREIPKLVTLADGTTAQVKAVAITVIDGQLGEVACTVEKQGGAWAELTGSDLRPQR